MKSRVCVVVFVLGFVISISAQTAQRVIPLQYKSCDIPDSPLNASKLWDDKITLEDKWCCFHAGYTTPQEHWVVMDLGRAMPLERIQIFHEGYRGDNIFNTQNFFVLTSVYTMDGPWDVLAKIENNTENVTIVPGNGKIAQFLKLLVTDPQKLGDPETPNDDYAVRILEMRIYATVEGTPPNQIAPPSATQSASMPFSPTTGLPTPTEGVIRATPLPGNPSGIVSPFAMIEQPTISATPTMPTPSSVVSLPVRGQKSVLYYFYSPHVQQSIDVYNNILGGPEILPLLTPYTIIPVNHLSDVQQFQQHGVLKIPTIIIVDPMGKEIKRFSGACTREEIKTFLR